MFFDRERYVIVRSHQLCRFPGNGFTNRASTQAYADHGALS